MGTAVAKKKSAELSTEVMDDVWEDAGVGSTFAAEEMTMPFIRLAQLMSPQVNKNKPEFIKGISAGDIFNTLTQEYFDGEEGLRVIPCYVTTKYTEWTPMDDGGGFVQELNPEDPIIQQAVRNEGKEVLPNGNEMVKADNFYILYESEDGVWNPAVLDMKITQLKVSRRWKSQINLQTMKHPKTGQVAKAPSFANIWRITSVEETNKKDQSYSNYNVTLDTKNYFFDNMDLYNQAKSLNVSASAGDVKVAIDPDRQEDQTDKSSSKDEGDEIPF